MEIKYELYSLANGAQVLLVPSKSTYSLTVSAHFHSGSALETHETQGLTHLIEHLAFCGTEKWPDKNELNILSEFNGGYYNAATSYEYLDYFINLPHTKLEYGIDFIHQILYKSQFNQLYIEKEKTVILDEIAKNNDDVNYLNSQFAWEKLSKNQSSYILQIGGTSKTVKSFTRQQIIAHNKKVHNPKRMLLMISGNFKESEAKTLIKNYFENIPGHKKIPELPTDKLLERKTLQKKDNKTQLVLTTLVFPGPSYTETNTIEHLTLDLVLKIMAGPASSRLKKRLREEEGLLYGLGAYSHSYKHMGANLVYFDIVPRNFKKAYKITLEELEKFSKDGVTEKELEHMKEMVVNRNLVHYDNIHSIAKMIRGSVFTEQEILTVKEMNKIIKSITKDKCDKVLQKNFDLAKMNTIKYGNV